MNTNPHVVISADQLSDSCVERIAGVLHGWATWQRIEQSLEKVSLAAVLSGSDIVVGWTDPLLLMASPASTYLCGSAGYDAYIGVGLERKPGFQMTSAGPIMASTIAEHCLALQFALARELPAILGQQSRRVYQRRWNACEIGGSTACIVGFGHSGTALAAKCRALGQKVIGVSRSPRRIRELADQTFPFSALDEAVADADHVFCLLAGGDGTRHTFRREVFAAMKFGACYYTASRGSVTHEADLIDALKTGVIVGAGIDVFEREPLPESSPLWSMPNVIVSPHSAGLSCHLGDRLTGCFTDNLVNLRENRPLLHRVPNHLLK